MSQNNSPVVETTDIAVIGAGVVGLAIARALAMSGREVVILESESAIGTVTSARNSGVIHAGLYYRTGSLKARFCVRGRNMLYEFAAAHNVPHKKCGKLVVATEPEQVELLHRIRAQGDINGVRDLLILSAVEARRLEPELSCVAALYSPSSGLVDQHVYMHELLGDAEKSGAVLALKSPVMGGRVTDDGISLAVGGDAPMTLVAKQVINAAGLSAQAVSRRIEGIPPATIPGQVLAKGNYFTVSGKSPFTRLIYPVPIHGGLGAHATTDLGGQARFGPDVEWVDNVNDYTVNPARADLFYESVRRFWPALQRDQLQPAYAGIRPKLSKTGSNEVDFLIQTKNVHGVAGLTCLYGIESPGLTSALAIGEYIADRIG